MKCYIINLDRSKERLELMAIQMRNVGLPFERVPAVDGHQLTEEELASLIPQVRNWTVSITPTEAGCFLSHKRCIEAIANGLDDYAIVLEDDIVFSKNAASLLSTGDWIPNDADIIKLETQGKKVLLGELSSCSGTRFEVGRLFTTHILAAAYIVTKSGANRILKHMDKVTAPVDHFLFNTHYGILDKLRVYQCAPAICRQAGLVSTLQDQRNEVYFRPDLFKRISRELKRLCARAIIAIWGCWINLTTKKKWGRVKADEL